MVRRTRSSAADLAAAWERNARTWIAWARAEGHDSYWRFNRDLFLEVVPRPGRRTLDLGCGEGRLSRDLKALGHEVVGVDLSETMLASAHEADPAIETHKADAAELPFADASFDCVVAFMSLQDIERLDESVAEVARVLEPGGTFCIAIVHPMNSAGLFEEDDADSPFRITGSYLDTSYYADEIERDGLGLEIVSMHRPLESYAAALMKAGLLIEELREPRLPESGLQTDRGRRWQRIPLFMYLRAVRH
jgi:SAM-dependent methyltransferase